jgi:hypothetical protein
MQNMTGFDIWKNDSLYDNIGNIHEEIKINTYLSFYETYLLIICCITEYKISENDTHIK